MDERCGLCVRFGGIREVSFTFEKVFLFIMENRGEIRFSFQN